MIPRPRTIGCLGALLCTALVASLSAQGAATLDTVFGRVTDSAGQPIGLASVAIPILSRQGATRAGRAFPLTRVPRGRFTLVGRRPGYAAIGPAVGTGFGRRVEVIRGPASVLYGPAALGGVVNVISEQLPDAAGGPGFVRSGFQLSGATNNAELGAGARLEGARGRLGWRVAGVGRFAASLRTPAGELENTGFGAGKGGGAAVLH